MLFVVNCLNADHDDDDDPSGLSLYDRIKFFNKLTVKEKHNKSSSFGYRNARFQTHPVTLDEVELAFKALSPVTLGVVLLILSFALMFLLCLFNPLII